MSKSNFTNNNGSFIISISRSNESIQLITSTNLCLNDIALNNDNSNTFLYFYDMRNNDLITIDDSLITSSVLDYGIYLASSLSNDETTNINI